MEPTREPGHNSELTQMTNNIEDMLEFHPEFLQQVSAEDRELLAKFFFAGREVDVEDVARYQDELEENNPGITDRAKHAYIRFMQVAGVN